MQIFEGIRDFIVQSVELKFNCFFLMPLVDTFPQVWQQSQLPGPAAVGSAFYCYLLARSPR